MIYKYVGAKCGAKALKYLKCFCEEYKIKISEPTSFNDPFEFKVSIDLDADEATMRERFFQDNENALQTDYDDWQQSRTGRSYWWIKQETRRELLSQFGVFCASQIEGSHLMWSHYTENHTGFCIGLDESQLTALNGLQGHGLVEYRDEAPLFRYYIDPPERFGELAVACKAKSWAYEHEYRFVFDRAGFLEFPSTALKEVILGCRAYPELRSYASQHCGDKKITFHQMVEDFQAYRLNKRMIVENTNIMSSFF